MNRINTVIFDLGGVLIDWNPRHLYRLLIADPDEMEWFLTHVCNQEWNEAQDAGRTFDEGVRSLAADFPEHRDLIAAYDRRWEEMLGGAIDDSVAILETLAANGLRLLALTNWSREKFPIARRRFGFLDRFQGIVVSGDEGMKKPDPRFYRLLLDRHDVDPARAVFIDDSARNVRGAHDVGLAAIRFENGGQLRLALASLGCAQF